MRALTDRRGEVGAARDASAADVATAWAIAKGTTPIVGVTKVGYLDGLARARGIELADEEIAELEELADAAERRHTRLLGSRHGGRLAVQFGAVRVGRAGQVGAGADDADHRLDQDRRR
ncbi:aldo/keto reductase [Actinoplanes sp. NPDC048796]|uniref:aldo/keto reductase n=1 Tax=unclassified Actinoplanes TaxID=2626549 RepID=UPI0033DF8E9E